MMGVCENHTHVKPMTSKGAMLVPVSSLTGVIIVVLAIAAVVPCDLMGFQGRGFQGRGSRSQAMFHFNL